VRIAVNQACFVSCTRAARREAEQLRGRVADVEARALVLQSENVRLRAQLGLPPESSAPGMATLAPALPWNDGQSTPRDQPPAESVSHAEAQPKPSTGGAQVIVEEAQDDVEPHSAERQQAEEIN
jgi:hypothetical protein